MLLILRHLDRRRFAPLLYLVDRRGELLADVPEDVPVVAFWDRHRYPRWNYPGRIHRAQVADFARVLAAHEIDVVYDRTWFMTLIAGPATRRRRVPRVSVIDSLPEHDLRTTAGRFRWLKRQLLRRAYAAADQVITVSHSMHNEVVRFYRLSGSKVRAMPNFIDLDEIDRLAGCDAEPLSGDRFHVVAAGRLQHEKGFGILLEAVQQLVRRAECRNLLVHLLGDGPQRRQLEQFAREAAIEPYVRFHGFVRNPYAFFRQAHLLCLPSVYEGLPNVLLEAMACRTPLVATDCSAGVRELLLDGNLGRLVPPRDAAALARAIEDAMHNYGSWKAITEPARRHVEQNYSLAAGLPRLEELLESVVRRQR